MSQQVENFTREIYAGNADQLEICHSCLRGNDNSSEAL